MLLLNIIKLIKEMIIMENKHNHNENCCRDDVSAKIIASSVIAAAIIISLSVFYNTKLVLNNSRGLADLQENSAKGTAALNPPAVPGQAPAFAEVAERKDAAVLGKSDAKVTIVEFSDFQCPFCEKFYTETYGKIKSQYIDTGKVKMIFRHFPLPSHANAQPAAVASECANIQGKFWQYHDLLFKNGKADGTGLAMTDLKKYADSLGLNNGTLGFSKNKFNQCLDANDTLSLVQADQSAGQSVGVNGTPTFFINGKQLVGAQPFSAFQAAIEEALKQ